MKVTVAENLFEMRYPIGFYIVENMPMITLMAGIIIQRYDQQAVNLWCRGSSGAIIAAIIAAEYAKNGGEVQVCHVKKEGEVSHNSMTRYNDYGINVIVDDLIATGATIEAIYEYQQSRTGGARVDLLLVSGGGDNYPGDISDFNEIITGK